MAAHGVVLYSVLSGRRWVVHTLTAAGEVWTHHEHDVVFQIPDFASKTSIESCGMWADAKTEGEIAARVEVLQKLRRFQKRHEYDCHLVPQLARAKSFYDIVAHPDPHTWSQITTREAAEELLGKTSTLTTRELFAVQDYLFGRGQWPALPHTPRQSEN